MIKRLPAMAAMSPGTIMMPGDHDMPAEGDGSLMTAKDHGAWAWSEKSGLVSVESLILIGT
jgi:hypothetical protein